MLNQVVLVGRLTEDPEIMSHENGKKTSSVVLAVQRTYKNTDGIYETDFIRCILWNVVAENTCVYCHKGDLVGVKGHIKTSSYEDKDGNKKYATDVVAEKITFLSSKPKEEK